MSKFLSGKVVQLPFGPGGWGIISDDGRKFEPVNLPPDFEKHGLLIRFPLEPHPPSASVNMWGEPVRLGECEVVDGLIG